MTRIIHSDKNVRNSRRLNFFVVPHKRRGKIRSLEKYHFFDRILKIGEKWERRAQRIDLSVPGAAGLRVKFFMLKVIKQRIFMNIKYSWGSYFHITLFQNCKFYFFDKRMAYEKSKPCLTYHLFSWWKIRA